MIVSFSYEDLDAGWTLEEVRFDALNLLVGPSGSGKSRILEALLNVRRAALRGAGLLPSARWRLEVEGVDREHEGDVAKFIWEAATKLTGVVGDPDPWFGDRNGHFVSERIKSSGRLVVERLDEKFEFDRKQLPKLTKWESAVGLLALEEAISPLHEALGLLRDLKISYPARSFQSLKSAEESRQRLDGNLDLLRRDDSLHPFTKLYVLQEDCPELFTRIADDFSDIFPTVEALKVATYSELGVLEESLANHLAVGMREEGVEGWVLHSALSSGMAKTLLFLIATALAPRGMVLLIDEIENSLGVNCLPDVASLMLKGLDRVQYLATSHHPRVINEIPFDRWKLVKRKGSRVQVVNARDIESLKHASSLEKYEKFTELINLPEYVEGVA